MSFDDIWLESWDIYYSKEFIFVTNQSTLTTEWSILTENYI